MYTCIHIHIDIRDSWDTGTQGPTERKQMDSSAPSDCVSSGGYLRPTHALHAVAETPLLHYIDTRVTYGSVSFRGCLKGTHPSQIPTETYLLHNAVSIAGGVTCGDRYVTCCCGDTSVTCTQTHLFQISCWGGLHVDGRAAGALAALLLALLQRVHLPVRTGGPRHRWT